MHFTDEQPFLDAVFRRYADDRPRLVYADYLDDSGEPERAELIRVQLALARLTANDPRRLAISDRQAELLTKNRAAWTAHLAGLVESVDFRRGIPDSASVEAATFLARGEELFQSLRLRRVRLREVSSVMPKLAASPLLTNIRELDLCNAELGTGGVSLLVRSPHLTKLDSLDLGFNGLNDASVQLIARSSTLPNLSTLVLNDNDQITCEGLQELAASPFFAGLTTLDVSGNDIGDAGVIAVAKSQSFPRLCTLRVSGNHIGDAGITAIVRSPLLARMLKLDSSLEFRNNAIGPAGVKVLAASPAMAACTSLDLSGNYLGDTGIAALLCSPHLSGLTMLHLSRNQLTDSGLIACIDLFDNYLQHLQYLDVSGNRLTRHGMRVLAERCSGHPIRIDLSNNVQTAIAGDAPVAVADLIDGVADSTRLRHQIANPRHLNE